uniref:Uncharacterized protein n=1 Tax=Euplotes harpa TaxID=151035 RepID=A0A7S3NI68_9SPIT|mmetsp:Transcript_9921/g.11145  ORF Transcript_9921/g.11145 Transcript_9921/m.11145 type:complete len:353 (+) Transcript_9921:234-1292(+)
MKTIITRNERFSVQKPELSKYPSQQATLHSNFRKRELERITKENYQILRRLQSKKSNYSAARWEQDRLVHEKRMHSIAQFPLQKEHLAFGKSKHNNERARSINRGKASRNALPKVKEENKTDGAGYEMGFVNLVDANHDIADGNDADSSLKPLLIEPRTQKKEKLIPVHVTNAEIDIVDDRKVIYRKIHKYDKKEYLIEISKTKTKYFIIAIELNKKQRTQAIEMHAKKCKKLIKVCGGVDQFANNISFKFGKIIVRNMTELLNQKVEYQTTRNVRNASIVTPGNEDNQVGSQVKESSLPSIYRTQQQVPEIDSNSEDIESMHDEEKASVKEKSPNEDSVDFPFNEGNSSVE